MASYTILKNQTLDVVLLEDMRDQGWTFSDGVAYHNGCNPGRIRFSFDLRNYEDWNFDYEILSIVSGSIKIIVNGEDGPINTTIGKKTNTFEVTGNNIIVDFYSTGENSLKYLRAFPTLETENSRNFMFNEDTNRWTGDVSWKPDQMLKMNNKFFSFKSGVTWEHNVNPLYNNFYGVQYESKITFVANNDVDLNKFFKTVKIDANGKIGIPNMYVPASENFPNGMKSRLPVLKLDKGNYWGDIKRDLTSPGFEDQLTALFKGRPMQGKYLVLELSFSSTEELKLRSVYVFTNEQFRNL